MQLLPRLRCLNTRRPWLWLLALLALVWVQAAALQAAAAMPLDLAPSLSSLCSAAQAPGDGNGHAGGHHDCCLGHGLGTGLPGASLAWQLPVPAMALLPVLLLAAPGRPAAWAPWQSRAPPRG
jgi:hypothetical protein